MSASPSSVLTDYANGDFTVRADALDDVKSVIPDFYQPTASKVGLTK